MSTFYYSEYLPKVKDYECYYKYVELVTKCLRRGKPKGYYEQHHIIPKCYLPKIWTLEETFVNNKVLMTSAEHYKAHYYLSKAIGGKMQTAFEGMSNVQRYAKNTIDDEFFEDNRFKKDPYRYSYSKYKRYVKHK